MDMIAADADDQLEHRVRRAVEQERLASAVSGFDVVIGDNWDGDPAVWLRLHIPADCDFDDAQATEFAELLLRLMPVVQGAAPGRSAFTTMVVAPRSST